MAGLLELALETGWVVEMVNKLGGRLCAAYQRDFFQDLVEILQNDTPQEHRDLKTVLVAAFEDIYNAFGHILLNIFLYNILSHL